MLFQQRVHPLSAHTRRTRLNGEQVVLGPEQTERWHEATPLRLALTPTSRLQQRPRAQPHFSLLGGDAELALAEAKAWPTGYECSGGLGHVGEVHSGDAPIFVEGVLGRGKGKRTVKSCSVGGSAVVLPRLAAWAKR